MNIENKKQERGRLDIVFQDLKPQKNSVKAKKQSTRTRDYRKLVLNLFEKTPEVGRLLVRLHDRNKLYHMANSPDDVARAEITQTFVDLLDLNITPAESELISDVLMGLLTQAERELRRALAERLAVMEGVPLRIVLKMASDEIFVADPVLRKSRDLQDFDLIYILKSKGKEHWQSMAMRPTISTKLIDMLADTQDLKTACHLTENKSINLSDHAVMKFFNMAKESETLAKPLLRREELSSELVSELYQFVGNELKKYITDNFTFENSLNSVVDDIIFDFILEGKEDCNPSAKMILMAEKTMEKGLLTPLAMVDSLRQGKIKNFVAQMSVYCAIPLTAVEKMVSQDTGQLLSIACKACDISKSDFTNMYLLTSRMRGNRIISENFLARALFYYDKIDEEMARSLLKRYRH